MNERRVSIKLLVGITIATISVDLPVLAVAQSAPTRVAQVACVVKKQTAIYTTANPSDPEVLGRILAFGTLVGLTRTLPTNPPTRVQIKQPTNGFVDYAALDCGRESSTQNPSTPGFGEPGVREPATQPPSTTSACRRVRNTINASIYVFREPNWSALPIAPVVANQSVYVTQTGDSTTSRTDESGNAWVEIDLQRTFGKNFGLSPSVGWLISADPNSQMSTLVNGCGR